MKVLIELNSIEEAVEFVRWRESKKPKTPLREADLTVRTARCLESEGFEYLEDAQAAPDIRLLDIPNFGKRALREVRNAKPNDQGKGRE